MNNLTLTMHRANGETVHHAGGMFTNAEAKDEARQWMLFAADVARSHETRYDDDGLLPVCVVIWSRDTVVGVVTSPYFKATNGE
jgi:hypothetical protein